MAVQRTYNGTPSSGVTVSNAAIDSSTTGQKLVYQCPVGKQAKVLVARTCLYNGSPTVEIVVTVGGNAIAVQKGTTQLADLSGYILDAADTIEIDVAIAAAASSFQAIISVEEYSVA